MPHGQLKVPAEWELHEACWMAFPYLEREWGDDLERAQDSIATLAKTIADDAAEPVKLLVRDDAAATRARALLDGLSRVDLVRGVYADAWTRDTAPIFGATAGGTLGAARFVFNAWGGKFDLADDSHVAPFVAEYTGAALVESALVLEGGALEFNGAGLCLTTDSCLLNPNRNPGRSRADVERAIREVIAIERFIWLPRGLRNDHTDGHVDMVARFVAENRVVCMTPASRDPNQDVLGEIIEVLRADRELELELIPSPGAIEGEDGEPLPGSYCNFYIGNRAVILPIYGVDSDDIAIERLQKLFPDRRVLGLDARPLLSQGGVFHCVTQPQPALR